MIARLIRTAAVLGAVLAAVPGAPALAAGAPAGAAAPAPAASGAAPQTTTASYGDWIVVCVAAEAGRRCEAMHMVKDARGQAAAVLSVGNQGRGTPPHLSLRVGLNATVAQPAGATIGDQALTLPFTVCVPQGCVGDMVLDGPLLARLAAMADDGTGTVRWRDATGQDQSLPLSTRGMAAAIAALGDQLR